MINSLTKLINEFQYIPQSRSSDPTFMEIARFPRRETVTSNILAFYLNPNNPHKLNDLFLKALFKTIQYNSEVTHQHLISVETEYPCNRKSIDIVVHSSDFIIGIENKIDADLYNDLKQYSKTLKELAAQRDCIKLVLSKRIENPGFGFKSITYEQLFTAVDKLLPKYIHFSDSKYLIFLLDFMKTIIKPKSNMVSSELYNFFSNSDNYNSAQNLATELEKVDKQFKMEFWEAVKEKLDKKSEGSKWFPAQPPEDYSVKYANFILPHENSWLTLRYESPSLLSGTPYYGIAINEEFLIENRLDKTKIRLFLEKILGEKSNRSGWWVWLKSTKYNFDHKSTKLKFTPAKRELLIEEFASKLWNIASEIDEYFETASKLKEELNIV